MVGALFAILALLCLHWPSVAIAKLGDSVVELKKRYGQPTEERAQGKDVQLVFKKDSLKIMCEVSDGKTDFMNVVRLDGKQLKNTEVFKFVEESLGGTATRKPEILGQFLLYQSPDGARMAALFQPLTILKIFTRERDQARGLIAKWKESNPALKPPPQFPGIEKLKAAAAQGDLMAEYQLGMAYYYGWECQRDPCATLKIWEDIAATKDKIAPNAQYGVASLYLIGEGTAKNEAKGMEWMKEAAENNHPAAQRDLGAAYASGSWGMKKDHAEGLKWTQKAVAQGDRTAEYNLGIMYIEGCGLPKDQKRGMELIQSAADKGYAYAKKYLTQHRK